MTQEKLATLFSVAVTNHHELYDFMPLTFMDEDKLDNTNSLEMLTFHQTMSLICKKYFKTI
jgi:hypothetical protein